MRVKFRVPATTANLGPGFDCLGMALSLYNEVVFETGDIAEGCPFRAPRTPQPAVRVMADGRPHCVVPLHKNLLYLSFVQTLERLGVEAPPIVLNVEKTGIPIARGLGSSAACIVAGVLAAGKVAEAIAGRRMEFEEAMDLAVEIEGHPDNVVPAMVGGMTAAVKTASATIYSRVAVPTGLAFVALVPSFRLTTEEARGVVPKSFSREDAVFNVGRAALLVSSFAAGDFRVLRAATEDRIHQPYRLGLVANSSDVISASKEAGSIAEFLSGSGPTIMAIAEGDGKTFAARITGALASIPGGWTVYVLKPDTVGAVTEVF